HVGCYRQPFKMALLDEYLSIFKFTAFTQLKWRAYSSRHVGCYRQPFKMALLDEYLSIFKFTAFTQLKWRA
ncbi:hypothetical protein CKQ79_29960, partial [Klebsiella pneumoniae]